MLVIVQKIAPIFRNREMDGNEKKVEEEVTPAWLT
jgi:hypothetical protein